LIATQHAIQRWAERFPGVDMAQAYLSATVRVGKKTRAKIQAACPAHGQFTNGLFNGRYYKMTRDQIVFVIAPPETVITVFRLGPQIEKKGGNNAKS